ncbi:MAG: type IV pilus secretin PilQ [Gammaproteobacteria bacterium]|nr:type IV pilus secretin PilQ [Gammaproteobacteria bacterium]
MHKFLIVLVLYVSSSCAFDQWTLDLQQVPLRFLLQSLAQIQQGNIVVSQGIKGKIDLHLKEVNPSQIWSFLVKTQHLNLQVHQGITWIEPAYSWMNTDKSQLQIDLKHAFIKLKYQSAKKMAALIQDKQQGSLSVFGKVLCDEETNTLWLADLPDKLPETLNLIQQWDRISHQVDIQARIVNISKNASKALGIRLGFLDGNPRLIQGTLPEASNLAINLPAMAIEATPMAFAIQIAKLGQDYIDAELSALEGAGKAKVISSPRLMTANREKAQIASGEDIPYQESSLNGATSIAFKKALLKLEVTPYVLGHSRIRLDIEIHQDADSGRRVQGVPVIATKFLKTNIVVQNGETIVLGGIDKFDKHREQEGIPLLKDIPLIGGLFSRQAQSLANEELLLFITCKF